MIILTLGHARSAIALIYFHRVLKANGYEVVLQKILLILMIRLSKDERRG